MINEKLLNEIKDYCKINNIKDIESEVNKLLRIGFNIEKYGNKPFSSNVQTQIVVKTEPVEVPASTTEEELKPKKRGRKPKEVIHEEINTEKEEAPKKKGVRIIKNK